jgi:outer membrane murein-binding lipoprotein Lpp
MRTGHRLVLAIMLACTAAGSGCVQSGPLQSHHTTVGTLKASVSHLEFEKEQLRKEVAQLKTENRRIGERLAQEETATGELTARLDDARVLLRSRGFDTDGLASPGRSRDDAFDEPAPATTPASRKPRKPPFTRIPGRTDRSSSSEETEEDPFTQPSPRRSGTFGPQSRRDGQSPWLPVARGADVSGASIR